VSVLNNVILSYRAQSMRYDVKIHDPLFRLIVACRFTSLSSCEKHVLSVILQRSSSFFTHCLSLSKFFFMLNLSTAVGFRGEPHYPVSPHGLHLGQRGVDAYPMHAITIAGKMLDNSWRKWLSTFPDDLHVPLLGVIITYFFQEEYASWTTFV
jgi:hypothetical protein